MLAFIHLVIDAVSGSCQDSKTATGDRSNPGKEKQGLEFSLGRTG